MIFGREGRHENFTGKLGEGKGEQFSTRSFLCKARESQVRLVSGEALIEIVFSEKIPGLFRYSGVADDLMETTLNF